MVRKLRIDNRPEKQKPSNLLERGTRRIRRLAVGAETARLRSKIPTALAWRSPWLDRPFPRGRCPLLA